MDEFEQLLAHHRNVLERFIRFRISNSFDADDIFQETCIGAYRNFDSLKDKALFKPWIISIARNKCNDYFRLMAKAMEIPIDEVAERHLPFGRMGIAGASPVGETLKKLGDKDKQILYLYYFRELPQNEIAERLGIPLGTVKSRLYTAKAHFKKYYPHHIPIKGENIMKKFPEYLPKYKIEALTEPAFPLVFEELPNWFIIPRIGEETEWASYDLPARKLTETVHSKVTATAFIHGVEGVEIVSKGSGEAADHIYYAQLTDTHCRWLGESYIDKNGAKRLLTFLDGDEFIAAWGYGEGNVGSETHLSPSGLIKRIGNELTISCKIHCMDVVGRYLITLNDTEYDTICVMEYFENGALTETYTDKNGRTVLWRRFNRDDWAIDRYKKKWSEQLPESDRLTVNGTTYVHWYDCISDYILG